MNGEQTPEQLARAAAERDPSPLYADGRPKMHRHFAEFAVHRDDECTKPSTRRRVYVFDTEDLEAHERFITERAAVGGSPETPATTEETKR